MITLADLRDKQPHAVETLEAAIRNARRHHAFVLVGQQPAAARALALAAGQALVCERHDEASGCGECSACRKYAGGNHPDVITIEPNERGVIPIDLIREASKRLSLRAVEAPSKVVLLYEADLMNPNAQNALLKTLEEPPGPTCFLLTATRYRALLPTVRSRSQRIRLAPPRREGAVQSLCAANVPEEIAPMLAALVGDDPEAALALVERGAVDVYAGIRAALSARGPDELLQIAADLGGDNDRVALATALLEVELRERLAVKHGADASLLYTDRAGSADTPAAELAATVDRIILLRDMAPFNLNRTLSVEGLLMQLTGQLRPRPSPAKPAG